MLNDQIILYQKLKTYIHVINFNLETEFELMEQFIKAREKAKLAQ